MLVPGPLAKPEVTRTGDQISLHTAKVSVQVDLKAGLVRLKDPNGKTGLQESPRVPRRYIADVVNGERVHQVEQRFYADGLKGLYGLGQHQGGAFDQRGTVVELAEPTATSPPRFSFPRSATPFCGVRPPIRSSTIAS